MEETKRKRSGEYESGEDKEADRDLGRISRSRDSLGDGDKDASVEPEGKRQKRDKKEKKVKKDKKDKKERKHKKEKHKKDKKSKDKKSSKKKHKSRKKDKRESVSDSEDDGSSSDSGSSSSGSSSGPRNCITGARIKMSREYTLEDQMLEMERAAKRQFMNSQY